MVGATLNCPRRFDLEELTEYMIERGVYHPGQQAMFHALDYPLTWLGLKCKMLEHVGADKLADIVGGGCLVILEALGHVIVVFAVNPDGTLVIGDPAMHKVEMNVQVTDYRLKGTGRIWVVRL
jgi:hypothetical protein